MNPTESKILATLDLALLACPKGRTNALQLQNADVPEWLEDYFGESWNSDRCRIEVEEFSAIGAFIQHCTLCFETGNFTGPESIVFEEDFGGKGQFSGEITAFIDEESSLKFLMRPANDLDVITRSELQMIRQTALSRTNFAEASSHGPSTMLSAGEKDFSDVESYLIGALDASSDAILILDHDRCVVGCNDTARELFPKISEAASEGENALREELLNQTVSRNDASALLDRVSHGINQRIESEWEFAEPYKHKRKVIVSPVKNSGGAIGTVWSFVKENDAEEFHATLTEAERMEAIGRLAGGVAHDFNNLLAIVLGNLTLLEHHPAYDSDEDLSTPVTMGRRAAEKAVTLVKQLLGYSRKTRLQTEVTSMEELVSGTTELFQSTGQTGIEVVVDLEDDAWDVKVDSDQMQQVIMNILQNAGHATGEDGKVTITSRNFVLNDRDMAEAMECDPGHYVIVTIADNGSGMDEDTREKVFEPFFTTKGPGKGTGLGLANALGIARQHGGNLTCTSALGQGTAFSIYLPRHRDQMEEAKKKSAIVTKREEKPAENDGTPAILVVDDEELLRNLVRTMLEKNGFRTYGAENGHEALKIIESHRDEIISIVLDLAMPEMTGTETFKRLNQMGSEIPVVVASGFLVDAQQFEVETGGRPYQIFSKPYQLSELVDKISEIRESSVAMAS